MKNLIRAASVAGTAALLAAGLSVGSAEAAPRCVSVVDGRYYAASACFEAYGDKITVHDLWADGYRAIGEWQTDYGRAGECHNANGADSAPVTCNYNMREDSRIRFRACTRDGLQGIDHACSYWTEWMNIG
ncbi:hypothetical protein [Streptomyces sp. NPDC049881]|uniref:hypothetical protein n=1 Tax=unclassified Streptomyces TaxID=2593676 RepID=UPI003418583F